jgi:hypothetical protein
MRVWRYTLTPKRRLSGITRPGLREGALIRDGDGVADVHPWPELGDAPLDEQLVRLARGETPPLTARSLEFARIDKEARVRGESLFAGLQIPASHWPGNDPPLQFDTAKVKGAREPDAFFERIRAEGSRLMPSGGSGFGFDDLLEKLPWKKLA